jgi:hypothetical protein
MAAAVPFPAMALKAIEKINSPWNEKYSSLRRAR